MKFGKDSDRFYMDAMPKGKKDIFCRLQQINRKWNV